MLLGIKGLKVTINGMSFSFGTEGGCKPECRVMGCLPMPLGSRLVKGSAEM